MFDSNRCDIHSFSKKISKRNHLCEQIVQFLPVRTIGNSTKVTYNSTNIVQTYISHCKKRKNVFHADRHCNSFVEQTRVYDVFLSMKYRFKFLFSSKLYNMTYLYITCAQL